MKLPEHVALSFLLAQLGVQQEYGPLGTGLMVAAGVLPDLDGLTIVGGWECHDRYHRVVGHGLPVTLGGPLVLAWVGSSVFGRDSFWPLWGWLQLSLVAHLVTDILFYRWPTLLLWPLSRWGPETGWVHWNDLVPTLLLYGGSAVSLAWPAAGPAAAAVSILALALYLAWPVRWTPLRPAWLAWLAGGWARGSPRLWRWLTGDFIT
jgi:hypothetical protein